MCGPRGTGAVLVSLKPVAGTLRGCGWRPPGAPGGDGGRRAGCGDGSPWEIGAINDLCCWDGIVFTLPVTAPQGVMWAWARCTSKMVGTRASKRERRSGSRPCTDARAPKGLMFRIANLPLQELSNLARGGLPRK